MQKFQSGAKIKVMEGVEALERLRTQNVLIHVERKVSGAPAGDVVPHMPDTSCSAPKRRRRGASSAEASDSMPAVPGARLEEHAVVQANAGAAHFELSVDMTVPVTGIKRGSNAWLSA